MREGMNMQYITTHSNRMQYNITRGGWRRVQVNAEEDYDGEHADYTLSVPPLQAEYDVIQTVIDKIDVRSSTSYYIYLYIYILTRIYSRV